MRTLLGLLLLTPLACADPADVFPTRETPSAVTIRPGAKTTGVPELDALLVEAKRTGAPVARLFNEDGTLQWFRATPDGWLSKIPPPVVERPAPPPVPVAYQPAPVMQQPRPVVAARPFRGGAECEYDPDHVCNRCGATQLVIARRNGDGTHTHVCGRCGHSWRHRN